METYRDHRLPLPRHEPAAGGRQGFSLTELLVASTIALAVMASVASLFSVFSRALSQGHATVEMTARMRSAAWKLRQDLAGVTVRMSPPVHPESNSGYFELIEGPLRDTNAGVNSPNLSADTDDILLFTTKSAGGPFVGRYGPNDLIESDTAEVAWFCRPGQPPDSVALPGDTRVFDLYRRQRLVVGYVGKSPFLETGNRPRVNTPGIDWNLFDISMRIESVPQPGENQAEEQFVTTNTLADLTDRRNRFGHTAADFPFPFMLEQPVEVPASLTLAGTPREGEDVMLTNVIAFDVRVYDPEVRAQPGGSINLLPGDPGYSPGTGAFGAYIDLGTGGGSVFGGPVNPGSRLPVPTYDTWCSRYEFDGYAMNGYDDNNNGVVDEAAEFETSPPYRVPLRGIEVRIRCYEPVSKQVRQITIRQAFMY